MANSIKHSTSAESLALNTGDFWIGTGDVAKGPTSTTGFWSAINPSNIDNDFADGYTIYVNKETQGPSIRVASSDAELITITNQIAGTSYATVNECFLYFIGESDKFVLNSYINPIITDGLVLALDASLVPSYPRSGTDWYDLSSEDNDGGLINSPTFNNGVFDLNTGGSNSERIEITKPTQLATDDYLTIEILFKLNTLPTVAYGNDSPILGAKIGSDYMIFAYPASNSKSHLGVSYDDSRYATSHESVFETEAGRWVQFTHVGIPYESGGYQRGKLMYYINGILDRDEFISGDSNGWSIPNPFYGGYDARWFKYSDISIAKIRMYNRQLTSEEISQNYYQSKIITDDLVFAVDAGNLVSYENGSTTTYSLVDTDTGTLTGGVLFNEGNGGTWDFDGDNDYINFLNPSWSQFIYTDPFSLEIWLNADNTSGFKHLIGKSYADYRLAQSGAGISFRLDSNNITTQVGTIVAGTWTHIVATWEPSTSTAYVYQDGELAGSVTDLTVDWTNTGNNFHIGTSSELAYYIQGKMPIGRAYSRTLTASEVAQNYGAEKGRFSNVSIAPQA